MREAKPLTLGELEYLVKDLPPLADRTAEIKIVVDEEHLSIKRLDNDTLIRKRKRRAAQYRTA